MLRGIIVAGVLFGLMFIDANRVHAQLEFGTPETMGPDFGSDEYYEGGPSLSDDGLELFFSVVPGDTLYSARRQSKDADFGTPEAIGSGAFPSVSSDGRSLYFSSSKDLWFMTRDAADADWTQVENLGPVVNSTYEELDAAISADGRELYFASNRPSGGDVFSIWLTKRETDNSPWDEPVPLGPHINATVFDGGPELSADGLKLFLCSFERSGGYGDLDLWMATRETTHSPWGEPVNLGPDVNTAQSEIDPYLSTDGSELYFSRGASWSDTGSHDLWRVPVVLDAPDGKMAGQEMKIVVPNGLENTEGDRSADRSFQGTGFRAQVAYSAEEFSDLPESHRVITGIALRPDASITEHRTVEWGDSQWYLSTTTRDVDDMSLAFAENHGANKTLVFDGPLALSTDGDGPPEGPRDFDYHVDLHTPFLYDPSQGSLVVDIVVPSGYTPPSADDQQYLGGRQQLVAFNPSDRESANFESGNELIVQFTFDVTLQAGDANRDLAFDQLDLVQVLQAGKYLTGEPATWGEGDWNGTTVGSPGHPPAGDGMFDQLDIVAALETDLYLTVRNAGVQPNSELVDIASVPEPSAAVLLMGGLVGLGLCGHARWQRLVDKGFGHSGSVPLGTKIPGYASQSVI